ncbi:tyrosine-type recombinase/integrase [Hymenobacter nivis]|uniref:tyrosine-type recombinase/integrase n=1 Tax=Hymenobacter nivis TaxID=1850093 RepID=UPI001375E0BD|nr:site-specific integrase [Hymenobacter nivis]
MNFSAKIKLRRPARRDGTCAILLQIIVGTEVWPRGLALSWPPLFFDEDRGECLASLPSAERPADYAQQLTAAVALFGGTPKALAKRADDYNLLIGQALAKANLVRVNWRLSGEVMTLERFKRDFETEGSKTDFVVYFRNKIIERHRKGQIGDTTRKNHFSTLNALIAFRPVVPFNTLTTEFADDFDRYLLKHVPGVNTRWGRHKDVKTYLAKAREDKLRFEDPYKHFKNRDEPGKWKPLKSDELAKLEHYYRLCGPRTVHRRILAKFLFSCSSSLRLGDLKRLDGSKVENQELTFKAHKTYAKRLQQTLLPLTNKALAYLRDAQEEEELPGFRNYADQYSNRVLTAIGLQLGIVSRLHWHVGRETFATEFIRRGGQVAVLQKLMDHAKISTTMKYVHVDDDMKRAAIAQLNVLDEAQ